MTISATAAGHSTDTRISLSNSNFPAAYTFSPNGDDVRVFLTDDLTPVDFAVTDWNAASREATIYVRRTIPASSSESYYIYVGDDALAPASDALTVFPNVGIRLHSRVSTADPTDAPSALAAFAAATVDVYDALRTTITGLNNRAVGGTNGNYGWCVSAVLNVTAATAGVWEFRYGGDFGRGGHLYVKGLELEAQWNDDLWWAGSYANTNETLSGSVSLPVGWHRYEALGFEGCCDGTTGYQARPPGGAWQNMSTTNFPMRGVRCIQTTATVAVGPHESCSTTLDAAKTLTVVSDPAGNASPYALPGSVIQYDLAVENPGQEVDAATIVLTDVLPPEVRIIVTPGSFVFTDGAFPSGLSFTYGGALDAADSVEFSTDGTDFTYLPTLPSDPAVTHVRFRPLGTLNANDAGDKPSFTISFLAEVK